MSKKKKQKTKTLTLKKTAIWYAENGWSVFPIHSITADGVCTCGDLDCSSPGKHPRTVHGFKDATTDLKTVRDFWDRFPDSNIATPTGKEAGIVVIDIDDRNGGAESFRLLRKKYELPLTLCQQTGGGGMHLLFLYSPAGQIRSRTGLMPGIDIKADGGYIVLAPSLHLSGREYAWYSDPQ